MIEGPNARDQYCVMCIPFILSGSPNECWLHTCDACVTTTWRLALQAPLVARKNDRLIRGYCLRPWRFFRAQNALSLPETPAMLANKGYGTEIKKNV